MLKCASKKLFTKKVVCCPFALICLSDCYGEIACLTVSSSCLSVCSGMADCQSVLV